MNRSAQGFDAGFTLIELLVVITIVAVLAAIVALTINPLELLKRARDDVRLVDLVNLQKGINIAIQDNDQLTSEQLLCSEGLVGGKCEGQSYVDIANAGKTDGSGWVKINLGSMTSATFSILPLDPLNTSINHYTYCSNGSAWEMDIVLESDMLKDKMIVDGGNETDKYEVGSNLFLIGPSGLCNY